MLGRLRRCLRRVSHGHRHDQSHGHGHDALHIHGRAAERNALKLALALILAFMVAEVTAGAARLFDPSDASALARTLLELLDDEPARLALARAGLSRAAHFSWEKTARATLAVYAEALRRSRQ